MAVDREQPRNSPARAAAQAAAGPQNPPAADPETTSTEAPPAVAAPVIPAAKRGDELTSRILPKRMWEQLGIASDVAAQLLAEACYVFGIDPNPKLKPLELAKWRFIAGDPDGLPPLPAAVSLVTSGGTKIQYPIDDDTEYRLRVIYNAFVIDKSTNEKKILPLPQDLTLPRQYVDGIVRSNEHQYRTGYLREGGKVEAEKRAERLSQLRNEGKIR